MDWLNQHNMDAVAFVMLSAATLASALGVVALRNLFHGAVFLAACLVSVGGVFLLLGGELIFAIQLLIYAGAVVILILFAVMLTRGIRKEEPHQTKPEQGLSLLVAVATFFGLCWVAASAGFREYPQKPVPADQATAALGDSLLTHYLVPFEVISVLLLVAMIGAILIAKPEPQAPADEEDE